MEKIKMDMCGCCDEIWANSNMKHIQLGKHVLNLCPDCYAEYIKSFNKIQTQEQEPNISLEVYKQVAKERDIAIEQLHELGYEFGQKIEPTTKKDCNTCTHSNETDGSNCYECVKDMCNNYEPTAKNDLEVDCISRDEAIQTIQRYGVGCFDADEFSPEECERFVISKLNELPSVILQEPVIRDNGVKDELNRVKNELESTTKNDLEVDAISRQALLNATVKKSSIWNHITNSEGDNLEIIVSKLPAVTPQEPKTENDVLISREKVMQILHGLRQSGLVTPRIIAEMEHDIKLIK